MFHWQMLLKEGCPYKNVVGLLRGRRVPNAPYVNKGHRNIGKCELPSILRLGFEPANPSIKAAQDRKLRAYSVRTNLKKKKKN
jgi:hypothetical protein